MIPHTLNLLLSLGLLSGTTSGSGASGSGGSGGTTGADVGKEVLHILALKSLFSQKRLQSVYRVRVSQDIVSVIELSSSVVSSYLGEEGSPDRLDILDLGSLDDGLDLVGLYHAKTGLVS